MEDITIKKNNELLNIARILRRNMTRHEKHLWYDFLRKYPIKIYKQRIIDNYVADFYCHQARLVIELDGSQHYTEKGLLKDNIRTVKLENRNLTLLRIPNNEINQRFDEVCQYIDYIVSSST